MKITRKVKRQIAIGQLSLWAMLDHKPTPKLIEQISDIGSRSERPGYEHASMESLKECPRCGDTLHCEGCYRCFNCQYEERS